MKVFVDTSALFAVLDADDSRHDVAASLLGRLLEDDELVTHNYIHLEAEALVRRRLGPNAAVDLVDRLLPSLATVWVDEPLHRVALAAYRAAPSGPSLVDRVSFEVMRRLAIDAAFAYDADFDAAGFTRPMVEVEPDHRLSERPTPYGSAISEPSQVVGVFEIAARSGRAISTVQSWRRRHRDFPAPMAALAAGPVWLWPDVERWIAWRAT